MAIPSFQDFFYPVLKCINNCAEPISRKDIILKGNTFFNLTDDELSELLPSGVRTRVNDRVQWSIHYLKQAELIENSSAAFYQITDFGKTFLQENVDFRLKELKEKTPFLSNRKKTEPILSDENLDDEQENNSTVILANEDYYESVESDLLERLKNMGSHTVEKGKKFEVICLELLEKMGYGNKERIGGSGDRGIDGFLTTDRFGFDRIGIQCKCHSDNKISDDQITKFAHGLKNVNGLNKGIFITTTDYMPSAKKVVEELKDVKIILINGKQLSRYMREYQIGVDVIQTNYVYDITLGDE